MFKITTETTITTTTTVDLASLPYAEWPDEAKEMARSIVALRHRKFDALHPNERKEWIVAQIYKLQDLYRLPISDWF